MNDKLSATMAIALGDTIERGGKLVRYQGGYWSVPNAAFRHDGAPVWYIGTTTVEALVKRGRLTYTEWKSGRNGEFPIAASVMPAREVAERGQ